MWKSKNTNEIIVQSIVQDKPIDASKAEVGTKFLNWKSNCLNEKELIHVYSRVNFKAKIVTEVGILRMISDGNTKYEGIIDVYYFFFGLETLKSFFYVRGVKSSSARESWKIQKILSWKTRFSCKRRFHAEHKKNHSQVTILVVFFLWIFFYYNICRFSKYVGKTENWIFYEICELLKWIQSVAFTLKVGNVCIQHIHWTHVPQMFLNKNKNEWVE